VSHYSKRALSDGRPSSSSAVFNHMSRQIDASDVAPTVTISNTFKCRHTCCPEELPSAELVDLVVSTSSPPVVMSGSFSRLLRLLMIAYNSWAIFVPSLHTLVLIDTQPINCQDRLIRVWPDCTASSVCSAASPLVRFFGWVAVGDMTPRSTRSLPQLRLSFDSRLLCMQPCEIVSRKNESTDSPPLYSKRALRVSCIKLGTKEKGLI
jgi:hypothetical protein